MGVRPVKRPEVREGIRNESLFHKGISAPGWGRQSLAWGVSPRINGQDLMSPETPPQPEAIASGWGGVSGLKGGRMRFLGLTPQAKL